MIEAYLKAYYEVYGNYTDLLVSVVLAIPNRKYYEPEVSSFQYQEMRQELNLLCRKRYSSAYLNDRAVAQQFKKLTRAYLQALDDLALEKKQELLLSLFSYEESVQEYFLRTAIDEHRMIRRLLAELREFLKVSGLGRLRIEKEEVGFVPYQKSI